MISEIIKLLFSKTQVNVLILGLDNAGKTVEWKTNWKQTEVTMNNVDVVGANENHVLQK